MVARSSGEGHWPRAATFPACRTGTWPGGMLASMEPDGDSAGDLLARAGRLLASAAGGCGNGEIFAWANEGDAQLVPQVVFGRIAGAGLLEGSHPGLGGYAPGSAADLMSRLREVDEAAAVDALTSMVSVSMAYRRPGRCGEDDARQLFTAAAGLLGRSARWWSNADGGGSNPVTGHTFDALVAGAGRGLILTVLAYDED